MAKEKRQRIKATHAEHDNRVTEMVKFLLNSFTRYEIHEKCSAWNLEARQIDEYMAKARDKIREINSVDREDTLATVMRNQWELFRAARDGGNIETAHKILSAIAKLKGLEETTVNHVLSSRPLMEVSDKELDEAFNAHGGH